MSPLHQPRDATGCDGCAPHLGIAWANLAALLSPRMLVVAQEVHAAGTDLGHTVTDADTGGPIGDITVVAWHVDTGTGYWAR